jgi:hypothetical protein
MGETSSRARAVHAADQALADRRAALIALAVAAADAQDGQTVFNAAEEKVTAATARARQRAAEILAQGRQEADQIRAAARREMGSRADRWRQAYQAARDAGWTVKELQAADQQRPPRPSVPRGTARNPRPSGGSEQDATRQARPRISRSAGPARSDEAAPG